MKMHPPIAFLSYARFDDDHDAGYISQFGEHLSREVQAQTGKPFDIFQDRTDIPWGNEWALRIDQAIRSVTFLLPVLTPSFFRSQACRQELEAFLEHEQRLGRRDLILPLYYIECQQLGDGPQAADPLVRELATRQYLDWRDLRRKSFKIPKVAGRLTEMARQIRDTLEHPGIWNQRLEPATKIDRHIGKSTLVQNRKCGGS